MSVALEAARDQKERQDEYLESSPVVVVFKDPRPVGGDPSVGVFVERCGYSSVQAALSGLDEGRLPMGPAEAGQQQPHLCRDRRRRCCPHRSAFDLCCACARLSVSFP